MRKLFVLGVLTLAACEKAPTGVDAPASSSTAGQTVAAAAPAPGPLDFPPARMAMPLDVMSMRIDGPTVGSVSGVDFPVSPVELKAIGVNLCQTGWFVQGYVEREGKMFTGPGFLLELAEIPKGPTVYSVPGVQGSHLEFDLQELSLERAVGRMTVVDDTKGETFSMTFDGTPVGVPSQAGFSAQGCFTTGYFRVGEQQGPAVAVFDGKDMYYVGMRLSERHNLVFLLSLRPELRQPNNVLQASLDMVDQAPEKYPFRVLVETRKNREGAVTGPALEAYQQLIGKGIVRASFAAADAKGPLRIELTDLEMPVWDGPLSGQKIPRIQAEVLFVTDPKSPLVPVPSQPNWSVVGPATPSQP